MNHTERNDARAAAAIRAILAAVALAWLATGCATGAGSRQARLDTVEIDWLSVKPVADGVRIMNLEFTEPRLMKAFIARVDLRTPGLSLTGTLRDPKWGEPMPDVTNRTIAIQTRRQRTADFLAQARRPVEEGGRGLDMVLAFNTVPWSPWEEPFTHKYAKIPSPMVSDGVVVSEKGFGRGAALVAWKGGTLSVVDEVPEEVADDVWLAHRGFNIILRDGIDVAGEKATSLAPRTACGLSDNGRWLYVLVVDGRQPEWSMGANMHDLAAILLRAGAANALNMDGGGSSTLVYWDAAAGEPVVCNQHSESGYTRPVAGNIGVYFEHGD